MKIDWNHVTKFSQLIAIVLFVAVFALAFWLGEDYEYHAFLNGITAGQTSAPTGIPPPTLTPHGLSHGTPMPE